MERPLVDVHCHIHAADFDADRSAVLQRAGDRGVRFVLAMGEGLDDNERVFRVAAEQVGAPGAATVLPCFGLHPDRAATEDPAAVSEQIARHADELAAVGEVGLDYRVAEDQALRLRQRAALSALVRVANQHGLALSVHSRSAGHYTVDLLAELGARRVCLHAFDGAAKHAARAAELGFLLSIPPSVVRSPQKQKMVRRLPLQSLLLETDAPVLGAERETRNEPVQVLVAARMIAELKGLALDEVLRVTSDNAWRLFGLERFTCGAS